MKFVLGSAQLGFPYGISNKSGEVSLKEAGAILKIARSRGINTIDTAVNYGDSESRLGSLGLDDWEVITKLPELPKNCDNIQNWIQQHVFGSLRKLRVNKLQTLLLHRSSQYEGVRGELIHAALLELKKAGLIGKIGVSIYDPTELSYILENFDIDTVQAPFSVLDNRLLNSGALFDLKKRSIEVHVRSIFLQGLLLMTESESISKFPRWGSLWSAWHIWLKQHDLTALEACVRYALTPNEIDRVIIGVQDSNQLMEIFEASVGNIPDLPKDLETDDINLLNPFLW